MCCTFTYKMHCSTVFLVNFLQGLKKSLKSFKFDDPELVEILLKYAFLWRNVHGILVKKIKDKQKFSSTEQFVASLMVIL